MAFISCLANLLFFLFLLFFGIYFAVCLLQNFFDLICQPNKFSVQVLGSHNTKARLVDPYFLFFCWICTCLLDVMYDIQEGRSNEHFVAVS